jgi:hypothetical protein
MCKMGLLSLKMQFHATPLEDRAVMAVMKKLHKVVLRVELARAGFVGLCCSFAVTRMDGLPWHGTRLRWSGQSVVHFVQNPVLLRSAEL